MPEPSQKVTYLSAMEVFRDLSPEEMAWIDQVTTSFTCPRGRILYTPGQTGEVLFLLKKGQVSIYRLSLEGKKMVLATLSANTLFGEMALVGQGMYDAFAEASEESELCTMSRGDLERLILTKPAVGLRLLEAMSQRLLEAETTLEDMAFKRAPGRLASLLLRVAQEQGGELIVE
ncbi:MAG: Crp/Fnr family transcriptional regulator, partial [Dehalococcoidia bacterium]